MENRLLENSVTFTPSQTSQWSTLLVDHQGHLLQSWTWGELKSSFGWTPVRLQVGAGAAQMLFRQLPLGLTIAYVPKGPLVDWTDSGQGRELLTAMHAAAKQRRAVFLKLEPNLPDSDYSPFADTAKETAAMQQFLQTAGFLPADTVQPQTSLVLDISGSEKEVLAAMKQKTRYNIRLARRKGVTVRQGTLEDVQHFHELSRLTADRDDFGIHSLDYYRQAYQLFAPDRCALFLAEFEGEPLAGLFAFCHGLDAYYFYGASSNQHRNLMPTYLIQWEAIRWAKSQGCTRYDLWGIPDAAPETLEAEFTRRHDGLWGVYRFKRGFGGAYLKSVGAFDYVYNPLLYKLYQLRRGIS